MDITLTPDLESIISDQVATGYYANAGEVVREGLLLLSARDALLRAQQQKLRDDIAIGLEQAARGQIRAFDAEDLLSRIEKHYLADSRPL
jgi:antitoxin ParD1/3/4